MANLVPRNFWDFPSMRVSSFLDDITDLVTASQADITASGLSVSEDDKHVHIEAAIPGVNPDDVEVTFDRGILWVRGEAKKEEKERKFYRQAQRVFSYRIAVPGDIDPNAEPQASYDNGVVRITLAKTPQSQPKKLTIKVGAKEGEKEEK